MIAVLYEILIGDDHRLIRVFFFVPLKGLLIEGQYQINRVATGSHIPFQTAYDCEVVPAPDQGRVIEIEIDAITKMVQ